MDTPKGCSVLTTLPLCGDIGEPYLTVVAGVAIILPGWIDETLSKASMPLELMARLVQCKAEVFPDNLDIPALIRSKSAFQLDILLPDNTMNRSSGVWTYCYLGSYSVVLSEDGLRCSADRSLFTIPHVFDVNAIGTARSTLSVRLSHEAARQFMGLSSTPVQWAEALKSEVNLPSLRKFRMRTKTVAASKVLWEFIDMYKDKACSLVLKNTLDQPGFSPPVLPEPSGSASPKGPKPSAETGVSMETETSPTMQAEKYRSAHVASSEHLDRSRVAHPKYVRQKADEFLDLVLVTFNANSVNANPEIVTYIGNHLSPDVLALQETAFTQRNTYRRPLGSWGWALPAQIPIANPRKTGTAALANPNSVWSIAPLPLVEHEGAKSSFYIMSSDYGSV